MDRIPLGEAIKKNYFLAMKYRKSSEDASRIRNVLVMAVRYRNSQRHSFENYQLVAFQVGGGWRTFNLAHCHFEYAYQDTAAALKVMRDLGGTRSTRKTYPGNYFAIWGINEQIIPGYESYFDAGLYQHIVDLRGVEVDPRTLTYTEIMAAIRNAVNPYSNRYSIHEVASAVSRTPVIPPRFTAVVSRFIVSYGVYVYGDRKLADEEVDEMLSRLGILIWALYGNITEITSFNA